jgi:hypothetical protein
MREELTERFGKSFEKERARLEIAKIKQSEGESPLVFNRRFKGLILQLGWDQDSEEALVFYQNGLSSHWMRTVLAMLPMDPPKNVTSWFQATEKLYHNQQLIDLSVGKGTQQTSTSGNRPPNFIRRPISFNRAKPPQQQFQPRGVIQFKPPVVKPDLEKPRMPCFLCKKEGHWAKNCPDKEKPRHPYTRVRMLDEDEALVMDDEEIQEWYEEMLMSRAALRDLQELPEEERQLEEHGEYSTEQDFQ